MKFYTWGWVFHIRKGHEVQAMVPVHSQRYPLENQSINIQALCEMEKKKKKVLPIDPEGIKKAYSWGT